MAPNDLHRRISDQFSYRGRRADIWRAFDMVLNTGAFLNLGYSAWYQPHMIGSSQRRLAERVGTVLSSHFTPSGGDRLLDIGCGRGGPAIHLAERFGIPVTGLDLVRYNVTTATENARKADADAGFVLGDASAPPFPATSFAACTAIDSFVYFSDREAVFGAIADVLEPGGPVVISDLLMRPDSGRAARRHVGSFAEAWDMPQPSTIDRYRRALEGTTLQLVTTEDLTPHSVGRFRKWTATFLWLVRSPIGPLVVRFFREFDLDPTTLVGQIRAAHRALPALEHVLLVAKRRP